MQLGLIKKNDNETEFGFGLSFLKGEQFFELNAYRANVFTSANGKDIDVDLLYSTIRSDTANKGWGAVNGLGASAGLYYQVPYYMFQSPDDSAGGSAGWKGFVRIEASDIGFIKWNGNSQKSIVDTNFHFEGVVIENLLEWSDSMGEISLDSLKNTVAPSWQNSSFTSVMPGYFHLKMYKENSAGLYLSMGTVLRVFSNYSPLIYIQGGHEIKNKYRLGGTVEFGGYGKFDFGIEASARTIGFAITLGTYNFAGLLFPNYFGGSSLYGGVKKTF